MHSANFFVVVFFLSLGLVHSAPTINRASPIGIFPVVDCPEDMIDPVLIVSSASGVLNVAANQYVVCINGKALIFNCSEGLFFNPSTMSCDFPYERSTSISNNNGTTSQDGDLDLIPIGPIPVPISPQWPVPIWSRRTGGNGAISGEFFPIPPYPITKPNPAVIMPVPVLPAHPRPPIHRPIPYYYYNH